MRVTRMRSIWMLLVIFSIGGLVTCRTTDAAKGSDQSEHVNDNTQLHHSPELAIVRHVYRNCENTDDFIGCLKTKAIQALSRTLEQNTVKIADGLLLERRNKTEEYGVFSSLASARDISAMPPIDQVLLTKADQLLRSHSIKIDMSDGRGHEEKEHEHKKKKKKKEGGHIKYVVAALLTAMGIAGPIGLKALAAIAVKALVISKVALTIAGIIALKKLFSHDHAEETSFQVHAGDHNRRSTFVVRPVTKSNGVVGTTAAGSSSIDPYRYYYEYNQ